MSQLRLRMLPVALFVIAFGGLGVARAEPPDAKVKAARSRFEEGKALFHLGDYRDALRAFAAGYELVHNPLFLPNLGQCYRKLGEYEDARRMYERFLAEGNPSNEERQQMRDVIDELNTKIEHAHDEPSGADAIPAPLTATTPPLPAPTPAPQSVTHQVHETPAPHRSFVRRNWWIFPVSAVVVAGVAVGIYFGTRGSACEGASYCACVGPACSH